MKKDNKKVQYALLGMVLLIWGTIAYQMMSWNSTDKESAASNYTMPPLTKTNQISRDSFVIKANYHDPFSNNNSTKTSTTISSKGSSSKKYERKTPPSVKALENKSAVKPPKLEYLGYSLNDNAITRVRISIDDRAFTFKLNEKKEKIRVTEMYKDSIVIRYRGTAQTLYRK